MAEIVNLALRAIYSKEYNESMKLLGSLFSLYYSLLNTICIPIIDI